MGQIGMGEAIIALIVVALLFGAKRLPEIARSLGQSLKIFKAEISRPAGAIVTGETTAQPTGDGEPPLR